VSEDESSSESCLHCDVNEVVREHIEGKDTLNLPEGTSNNDDCFVGSIAGAASASSTRDDVTGDKSTMVIG
jgi:hypothetical protein